MGRGKQQWRSWAVTASPHRCRLNVTSLKLKAIAKRGDRLFLQYRRTLEFWLYVVRTFRTLVWLREYLAHLV